MPSISDQHTVNLIASNFVSNGRNKEKALIDADYSKSYARAKGWKLYGDKRLIKAIERLEAQGMAKSGRTVEDIDSMQQAAYDLAIRLEQPAAAVSAGTALARLYGMDKDNRTIDEPLKTLTEEEFAQAQREAILIRNMRVS